MGHYDRLSQTENDRCISLTRPSLGLPVVIGRFTDTGAMMILPPWHPIMLIEMIYSFIVIILQFP